MDAPGELGGYVEYNSALFDGATIDRWMAAFIEVLEVACDDPDRPLSELAAALRDRAGRHTPLTGRHRRRQVAGALSIAPDNRATTVGWNVLSSTGLTSHAGSASKSSAVLRHVVDERDVGVRSA